ncbi:DUF5412 domain-containing protein [Gottfriedia acidiceleris]|uniref:DUF5412 domain-containing protein n=1 Tax=Gottfriedia acidiceleris TaxID=371036 RepID=UPI003B5875EB
MSTIILENKKNWQKRRRLSFKILISVSVLFLVLIGYGVYWVFFDMNRLPKGDYLTEEKSPNGNYTIKAFVTNGGATTGYAVRGELVYNKEKKSNTVYWNYRESAADIEWIDNDTVVINGHTLNIPDDKFDFRHN